MKYSVGIDLGGTKLAAALVDEKGNIIAFRKESIVDLKVEGSPVRAQKKIIQLMVDMILGFRERYPKAFQKKSFIGVGLACAGPLNVKTGSLVYPVNFPGWKIVPIQKNLFEALKAKKITTKVAFQNDAVAAAFAEGWIGGAQNLKTYAVITVGTGVGTGIIFHHRPVQTSGMGSEFGHLISDNKKIINIKEDLHPNTIEGEASGTGMLRKAKLMGFKGNTIEELVQELEAGNYQYQILFDEAADALAALCYNLSIGFNIEKFLFSGGLIKIRHLYFERMKKRYQLLIDNMNPEFRCPLQVAKCLNQAGVLGAARLPYLLLD